MTEASIENKQYVLAAVRGNYAKYEKRNFELMRCYDAVTTNRVTNLRNQKSQVVKAIFVFTNASNR